jgi:sentrin-specific protease 7
MALLFHRNLLRNDKVGTSPLIEDALPTGDEPKKKNGARSTDSALWNLLSANTKQDNENSTSNGNDRASNRPTRSTRSTAPILDSEGTPKDYEVEKYSVRNGLGPRWHRPLTYGGGPKATVFFEDLPRLDEEEFLNDNIIDFSMIYLFEKSNIPRNKVFFFNTFFFTKLTEKTGRNSIDYKAVQKWTSKVDIFLYDYIVVPINEQTHWYLAIICNVGNIARRPVEEDFGETAATEVADDEHARSDPNGAADIQATPDPQLVDPPQVSTPQQSASDQEAEDVNLFDEDSKLDIIDPEATGSGQQVPLPSIDLCLTRTTNVAAANAVDTGSVPRTVLSNLNASPAKKKSQRKFKGQKRDPNVPIIMILDSLSTTRSGTVRALKDWLAAEGKARRGMEATIKEHGFYPKSDQIPTQNNWTDCGVYLLGYAEKFFADPDDFKTKLLTGEMTADEDWPQLKPKEMRNNLRDIIFALAEEQKLTVEKKKKGKKGTGADKSSPPGHVAQSGDVHPPSPPEQSHQTRQEVLRTNVEVSIQEPGVMDPVKEQPNELPTPRLGSPIVFMPRNGQPEVDANPSAVVAQVS